MVPYGPFSTHTTPAAHLAHGCTPSNLLVPAVLRASALHTQSPISAMPESAYLGDNRLQCQSTYSTLTHPYTDTSILAFTLHSTTSRLFPH
jgi:hypothetical protein